jgi:hypothetical protein
MQSTYLKMTEFSVTKKSTDSVCMIYKINAAVKFLCNELKVFIPTEILADNVMKHSLSDKINRNRMKGYL